MLKRAWCPGDIATNKAGAVAVNTDVAQEGFADRLFRLRETIAIPRNGGAGEIERVALCVHDHFHRIRIERLFSVVNRHRKGRHANLTLGQVVGHLTDNSRRDHRLIALHVHNHRLVTETAFFDDFRQALGA